MRNTRVPTASTQPQLSGETLRAFGVPHAFSTRRGGVSRGTFDSLNFGNPGDLPDHERDPASNIARNLEILLEWAGIEPGPRREVVQVHQVHGASVLTVRRGQAAHNSSLDPRTGTVPDTKADAIVTDDPTRVLCIRTADCVPLLLASADGRIVGAVHAGWRGVVAGVAPATLAAMRTLGARDIRAVIGPCISQAHFEVGPEVVREFVTAFGASAPCRVVEPANPNSKGFVDLPGALRLQLAAAGIGEIETIALCTVARPDLFFSHRRDNGRTGRMAAIIAPHA